MLREFFLKKFNEVSVNHWQRAILCSIFAIVSDMSSISEQFAAQNVINALGNPTLLCILGSRMFFNLREAGEAGVNEGTNVGSYRSTTSSIGFQEPNDGEEQCVHIFQSAFEANIVIYRHSQSDSDVFMESASTHWDPYAVSAPEV